MHKYLIGFAATAALALALGGTARAGTPLASAPVEIDTHGWTMFCDASNVGTSPVQIVTEYLNFGGTVKESHGPKTLDPGYGVSYASVPGDGTAYCRITVVSGNPKSVRAMALIANGAGRYLSSLNLY